MSTRSHGNAEYGKQRQPSAKLRVRIYGKAAYISTTPAAPGNAMTDMPVFLIYFGPEMAFPLKKTQSGLNWKVP